MGQQVSIKESGKQGEKNPFRNTNLIGRTLGTRNMNHIKNNRSLAELFSLFSIREVYPGHASHLLHEGFHARDLIGSYLLLMESGSYMAERVCGLRYHCKLPPKLARADCVFNILSTHTAWICWGRAMVAVLSAKLCWAWGTVWVIADKRCLIPAPLTLWLGSTWGPDGISMRFVGEESAPSGQVKVFFLP